MITTDQSDEYGFRSQCSLNETMSAQSSRQDSCNSNVASTSNVLTNTTTASTASHRHDTHAIQTSLPMNHRHTLATDILSMIRSFASKPFKGLSTANMTTIEQRHPSLGIHDLTTNSSVSLLKYRPLHDSITDHTHYTQSTRVCIRTNDENTSKEIEQTMY
jgi:hypothetical protein